MIKQERAPLLSISAGTTT